MTNGWTDIANADVILAMGGNPAENHPVGFRFVMEAKRRRNAKLVNVDPRFNRTSAVSDYFVQIRAGSDIAFLAGLIHYVLEKKRYQEEYVRLYTNAPKRACSRGGTIRSRRTIARPGTTNSMETATRESTRRCNIRGPFSG
jgi:anaerobic selenocysteine-containing dehydrogenase